jgi:hypothetical protein
VTKEKQEEFILRVGRLLEQYPPDRLLNIDETNWKVVAGGFWTWADTGARPFRVSSMIVKKREPH